MDLSILLSCVPSSWSRLFTPILPRVVEQVIRKARCPVFQASPQDRFDCEDLWGRSGSRMDAVLGHLDRAPESKPRPQVPTEDAWTATRERHRATA